MITYLLYLTLITSLLVLGSKIAMSEGMLMERLGNYFEKEIDKGNKHFMMLFCPYCMSTLYTIPSFIFAFALDLIPLVFDWRYLIIYLLNVAATSIIAGNFWNLYLAINSKKEYHESAKKYYDNAEKLTYFDIKDRKSKFQNNNHR